MVRERSVIPVSSVLRRMSHSHHQRQSDNYLFDLWLPFISAVRMMRTYPGEDVWNGLDQPSWASSITPQLVRIISVLGGRGTGPIQSLRRNNLVVISQFPWRRGERISPPPSSPTSLLLAPHRSFSILSSLTSRASASSSWWSDSSPLMFLYPQDRVAWLSKIF